MVVVSAHEGVYGPFSSIEEAMRWTRFARDHISMFTVIEDIKDPDHWGSEWRQAPAKPTWAMTTADHVAKSLAEARVVGHHDPMTREKFDSLNLRST